MLPSPKSCPMSSADFKNLAYFKRVLPTTIGMAQTQSGYVECNDKTDIMLMYAHHLVNQLPRGVKGFILFMDGYGGHFSKAALDFLKANGVYVCFLRSQNSEMDQPNDNGPNGKLKSLYNQALAQWRAEFVDRNTNPFRPRHFNEVFCRAWDLFTRSSHEQSFERAWERCGLYPLNMNRLLERQGAVETGVWFNTSHKTPDKELEEAMFPIVRNGKVHVPAVILREGQQGNMLVEMTEHSLTAWADEEKLMRRYVIEQLKPVIRSAAENAATRAAEKKGQGVKIRCGVPFGRNGNPLTIEGLHYSPAVSAALGQQREEVDTQASTAAQGKHKKDVQKAEKLLHAQSCADQVHAVLHGLQGAAGLDTLSADTVIKGLNILLAPQKFKSKKEALEALRRQTCSDISTCAQDTPATPGISSLSPAVPSRPSFAP